MYKVYFEDGTVFEGGTIENSKWNEIPQNKLISRIEYPINGHIIRLEGYEAYNHIVEKALIVNRGYTLNKLILMVKQGEDVMLIIYDIRKNQFKPDLKVFGKEYNNKSIKGWKKGILGKKGNFQLKRTY